MKRSHYIFPLMAFTALSLTLAGCDDNKAENGAPEDTAAAEQTMTTPPVDTTTQIAPPAALSVPVTASNAYAYATAEGATTGAIFLTLNNTNATSDQLIGARSSKAPRVEIHESYVDEADGTMQMRQVQSVDVTPGQPVELKPGGYHIMLFDLAEPLVEGQTFEVTLNFANGGEVTVPVTITAPGQSANGAMGAEMTAPASHDHSHMEGDATTATTPSESGAVVDEVTPDPTPEAVPSDEPVTDVPAAQ